MKHIKQSLTILLSYTLTFMPLHAANLQTDGTTNTTIEKARNDVPVVNIANPNATGLSHNKFNNYNVDKQGLILNNSKDTTVNTQLGGYIFGNKNLTSNAKVILNEVTSTSRSQLNGYTEVAGQRADLIIANPNGLSVNGAGFINTSNVTLTTGVPIINGGNLDSFNILGGDISIEGDGLDSMGPDSTSIYAHFLQLNADIHAKNLDIKLGKNSIDANTKQITSSTNSNEVALLLDASALGGMYANRISLVGTDKGLGVNLPPEVLASTGEITITNDGNIKLQSVKAKTDISIDAKSSDIEVKDTISAGSDINIKAENVTNNALVHSGNNLTINSTKLNNSELIVSKNITIEGTTLNNNNGIVQAIESLSIDVDDISIDNSKLYAKSDFTLKVNELNNISTSSIGSGGNLNINARDYITNDSDILANGSLTLSTNGNLINKKIISSSNELTISSGSLTNDATIAGGSGTSSITATTNITNNSRISGENNLNISATDIVNSGYFNSGNTLAITSNNLTNNKTIFSANDMNLYTQNTLQNNENANIFAINNLTMASDDANNKTELIENISANIESYQGDINIHAKELFNKRVKAIDDDVFFTSRTISDSVYFDEDIRYGKTSYGANNLVRVVGTNYNDTFFPYVDDYGFRLHVDLAKEPFSYHFATFGVVVNEKLPYDNPNYKASSILAGHNLNINADNVYNEMSNISSANDMNLNISNEFINRTSNYSGDITLTLYHTGNLNGDTVNKGHSGYLYKNGVLIKRVINTYGDYNYGTHNITNNDTPLILANVTAGGSITGDIAKVKNGNVKENDSISAPTNKSEDTSTKDNTTSIDEENIIIPEGDYGLFVKTKEPNSKYLIETNPEFALFSNFISSDYMMKFIDYDAEATTKRLGDALYENTIIRDSILKQTGKRFLNKDIKNDNEQYKHLMDNAIAASKSLDLSAGISLSKEQINALTQDIVWMEEKEVEGTKVLVPVVYIANINNYKLRGSQIVAGDDISLKVASFTNSGNMKAGNNIYLNVINLDNAGALSAKKDLNINAADTIQNNGGLLEANEDIKLQATNDIKNISADIKAKNIDIKSTDGDVINERYSKAVSYAGSKFKNDATLIGKAGNIIATGSLNLNANQVNIKGSNLKANNIDIKANQVEILSSASKNDLFIGDSDNYIKEKSTTHLASNINAQNLNINSSGNTIVKGSNLNAANNLNIKAKKIDILAVNDSSYIEKKSSSSGFMSSSTTLD
ncbi:filamentous hemagglutinin N-terminal domain-containing protein, partial [Sulfurimonas sp.]|uniref:two-partner secretion domain-containing protein n=1 Tax=Sulfurimonas sp. TaxID=2022749 RepID=UPI003561F460